MIADRVCDWCDGPIPPSARSDAVCCSKRCRQARHRFGAAVGAMSPVADGHPRRLAYADPPYPGRSRRYYGDHPDYAGEVDHAALIASLAADYDAWALSTAADSLQDVLALCPPGVRVAAWFRGARPHRGASLPINGWEPVIYAGQLIRRTAPAGHDASVEQDLRDGSVVPRSSDASRVAVHHGDTSAPVAGIRTTRRGEQLDASRPPGERVDALVYRPGVRSTDPGRVIGAKPAAFCGWIFDLLGAQPGDTLVDVFPGSGGVARAWDAYTSRATSGAGAAARRDASCSPANGG